MITQIIQPKNHSFAKKSLCLFLICFLSFGNLSPCAAENSGVLAGTFSGGRDLIRQIYIPEGLGRIEAVFAAPSRGTGNSPLIVYIKDAHANYEAQCHIRDILKELHRNFGFHLIASEGAVSKLDRRQLEFFEDKNLNLKVADFLARKGELSGVDLFVLEEERAIASGIENADAYAENLKSFRKVMDSSGERKQFLKLLSSQTDLVVAKLNNKKLRKHIRNWQKLGDHSADISVYVASIAKEAKTTLGIDLANIAEQLDWPELTRIVRLREIDSKLNAKAIEGEQTKIAEFLRGIQAAGLADDLERASSFQKGPSPRPENGNGTKTAAPRLLYEKIFDKASPRGFLFSSFPEYGIYAQFLVLQSEIDSQMLFNEVEQLSEKLFSVLAKTSEEQELVGFIKDQRLLAKILSLELVRNDFDNIASREGGLNPVAMESRVNALKERMSVSNHKEDLASSAANLESCFDTAIRFYEGAKRREQFLIRNTLGLMDLNGANQAVLVTGGFHTDGIREKLEEEGVSYIVIAPNFKVTDGENQYLNVMMNRRDEQLSLSLISAPDKLDAECYAANAKPFSLEVRKPDGQVLRLLIPRIEERAARLVPQGAVQAAALGSERITPEVIDEVRRGAGVDPVDLQPLARLIADALGKVDETTDVEKLLTERAPAGLRSALEDAFRTLKEKFRKMPLEDRLRLEAEPLADSFGARPEDILFRRWILMPPPPFMSGRSLTPRDVETIRNLIVPTEFNPVPFLEVMREVIGDNPENLDTNELLFNRVPEPLKPEVLDLLKAIEARFGELPEGERLNVEKRFPRGLDLKGFRERYQLTVPARPPLPAVGKLIGPEEIRVMRLGVTGREADLRKLGEVFSNAVGSQRALARDINVAALDNIQPAVRLEFLEVLDIAGRRLSQMGAAEREAAVKGNFPEGLDLARMQTLLEESLLSGMGRLIPPSEGQTFTASDFAAMRSGLNESLNLEPFKTAVERVLGKATSAGANPNDLFFSRTPESLRPEAVKVLREIQQRLSRAGSGALLAQQKNIPAGIDLEGLLLRYELLSLKGMPVPQAGKFAGAAPESARLAAPGSMGIIAPESARLTVPMAAQTAAMRAVFQPAWGVSLGANEPIVEPVNLLYISQTAAGEKISGKLYVGGLLFVAQAAAKLTGPDENINRVLALGTPQELREEFTALVGAIQAQLSGLTETERQEALAEFPVGFDLEALGNALRAEARAASLGQLLNEFLVMKTPEELRPELAGMLTELMRQVAWVAPGGRSFLLTNGPAEVVDLGAVVLPELIATLERPLPFYREAAEAGNIGSRDLELIREGLAGWDINPLKAVLERVQKASPVFQYLAMGRKELLAKLGSLQGSSDEINQLRSVIALSLSRPETWVMNKRTMNTIVTALLGALGQIRGEAPAAIIARGSIAYALSHIAVAKLFAPELLNAVAPLLNTLMNEVPGDSAEAERTRAKIGAAVRNILWQGVFPEKSKLYELLALLLADLNQITGSSTEALQQRSAISNALMGLQSRILSREKLSEMLKVLANALDRTQGQTVWAEQARNRLLNVMKFMAPAIGKEELPKMKSYAVNALEQAQGLAGEQFPVRLLEVSGILQSVLPRMAGFDLNAANQYRAFDEVRFLLEAAAARLDLNLYSQTVQRAEEILGPGNRGNVEAVIQGLAGLRSEISGTSMGQALPQAGIVQAVSPVAAIVPVASAVAPVTELSPVAETVSIATAVSPITALSPVAESVMPGPQAVPVTAVVPVAGQSVSPEKLPGIAANMAGAFTAIQELLAKFAGEANQLLPVFESGSVTSEQIQPLQTTVYELNVKISELVVAAGDIARAEGLKAETREQANGLQEGIQSANLQPVLGFVPGPIPAVIVERQVRDLVKNLNELVPALNQTKPVLDNVAAEFPKAVIPVIHLPEINPVVVNLPGRTVFLDAVEQFTPIAQYLSMVLRDQDVSLAAELEGIRVAGGFVQAEYPREVMVALLDVLYPKLKIGERLYTQSYLTARQRKLKELAEKTYDSYFRVDTVNAGAEILVFGERLPTEQELLSLQLSLQLKTKLYVRIVINEGLADAEKLMEIYERMRSKLDFSDLHYPIGDRFDIVAVNPANIPDFVRDLPMKRLPGTERTLFESVRRIAPEQIVTPLDLYRHLVILGPQEMVSGVIMQEEAWRVYPSRPMNSKEFRKIAPYIFGIKLSQAALLRDQLPEEDQREFRVQSPGLFNFVPNPSALAQFLSVWVKNVRKLLAAA